MTYPYVQLCSSAFSNIEISLKHTMRKEKSANLKYLYISKSHIHKHIHTYIYTK